jgi:thiol-disulfide isomerase/thioredoxin
LVSGLKGMAQADTLPPYKKQPTIPAFNIILADSTWYGKNNLPAKKPVLILYFSPDCGHCQLETEEIISKMKDLKKLHIVMVTSKPYQEMLDFYKYFRLERFSNIKVGTDPNRRITRFYAVKFTPFSALYDKKGKLINSWEKGMDFAEVIKAAK